MIKAKIEESWLNYLSNEFESEYMKKLSRFLKEEKTAMEIKIKFPKNINVDDNQLLPSLIHDGLFYVLLEKK